MGGAWVCQGVSGRVRVCVRVCVRACQGVFGGVRGVAGRVKVCQGMSGGARECTRPECLQRVDDILVPLQLVGGVLPLVRVRARVG